MTSFRAPSMDTEVSSHVTHFVEFMGAPRIFENKDLVEFSARAFLKANQRCCAMEEREDDSMKTWSVFEKKFLTEFSTTRTDWQIRIDLHTHKQGPRSIAEYTASFRSLSNQCNYGDEALTTAYFLGLNLSVQNYLESLQLMPRTFAGIYGHLFRFWFKTYHLKEEFAPFCIKSHPSRISFSTDGNRFHWLKSLVPKLLTLSFDHGAKSHARVQSRRLRVMSGITQPSTLAINRFVAQNLFESRQYLNYGDYDLQHQRGLHYLFRIRTGSKRLSQMRIIDPIYLRTCPFCGDERPETVAHLLCNCPRWVQQRREYL